jgi:hypothetical protein
MATGQACCQGDVVVDGDSCCVAAGMVNGYIKASQTCCDGYVSAGLHQDCCGPVGFDATTHVCCSGSVLVAGNSCCQTQVESNGKVFGFDNTTHTCCDGVVVVGVFSSCCGAAGLPDNAVCCQFDNRVYASFDACCLLSDGSVAAYHTSTSSCCNGAIATGTTGLCCGQYLYDPNTQVCCNDNPVNGSACCGNQGFVEGTGVCCRGVFTVGKRLVCCGTSAIDPIQQACCDGVTFVYGDYCCPLSAGGYQGFEAATQSCCGGAVVSGDYLANPSCYYNSTLGQSIEATPGCALDLNGCLSNKDALSMTLNGVFYMMGGAIDSVATDAFMTGFDDLTYLVFYYNSLKSLPSQLFSSLSNLQFLGIANNPSVYLPPTIFNGLSNLLYLTLTRDQLTSLPPTIFSELRNLIYLDLSYNSFTSIPATIFSGLGNLAYLDLSNNPLTSLPQGVFSGLVSLEDLYLPISLLNVYSNSYLGLPTQFVIAWV